MKRKTLTNVFFDLDGTLLDTAPDLANAINRTLANHNKPPIIKDKFRFHIHGGTKSMLCHGFNITPDDPKFQQIKQEFHQIYRDNIAVETNLFPHMDMVLNYLDQHNIPWGIITSKLAWHAEPLIAHFGLDKRSTCIISGDTLDKAKPHPDPLLHACKITDTLPQESVYIGDTEVDTIAANAAGMRALVMLHGYRPANSTPEQWHHDQLIQHPQEIIHWIETKRQPKE